MPDFFTPVINFVNNTHIIEQIRDVEVKALFTNSYFIFPFILYVGWMIYKQALNNLVILGVFIGLWVFSGSFFMENLIVNGELQISKVLPVAGVGILAIAIMVYFFFIRSD